MQFTKSFRIATCRRLVRVFTKMCQLCLPADQPSVSWNFPNNIVYTCDVIWIGYHAGQTFNLHITIVVLPILRLSYSKMAELWKPHHSYQMSTFRRMKTLPDFQVYLGSKCSVGLLKLWNQNEFSTILQRNLSVSHWKSGFEVEFQVFCHTRCDGQRHNLQQAFLDYKAAPGLKSATILTDYSCISKFHANFIGWW